MPTELSGADVRAVMYRTLMMGALHQLGLSAQKIRDNWPEDLADVSREEVDGI